MNKKQLIVAAVATALSVTAVNASNISGFDQTSGTFNIDPAKVNGDVGYRAYENFNLSEGDIANLIFRYKAGTASQRDIETFVNLVQNRVDINGIINSVRDGSFHPGHAVFISPNGVAVGASGVINVGTLSIATPSSSDFNRLKGEYAAGDFSNINQISQLKHNGNAPIKVDGYIFTKNGVDLPGSDVSVSGKVVNGMMNQSKMTALSQAEALFNQLVNTDGTIKANSSVINPDGSLVFLHQTGANGGINVSGSVVNLTNGTIKNGSVALTSNGAKGLTVSGDVAANGKLSLYNKAGDMNVSGRLLNKDGELALSNGENANNMTLTSNAILKNTNGDANVINNGKGNMNSAASITATGDIAMTNAGKVMNIAGNQKGETIRIINRGSGMEFVGNARANESISFRNYGANGMALAGKAIADEGILVDNKAGDVVVNGTMEVVDGNIAIMNRATAGALKTGESSNITTEGKLVIKNSGSKGMDLKGTLTNFGGETAINNLKGAMTVKSKINNDGNMGIINKGEGKMTLDADITNMGRLKLANINGEDFEINNKIVNTDGNTTIYNENGELDINGTVEAKDGYLYILSRYDSEGIVTGKNSLLSADNGNLAIKHNGVNSNAQGYGMDLNGLIAGDANENGELAINNYTGDMHVGGTVMASDGMGIINRAGGEDMVVDATIATTGDVANIKNNGSGDMTVAGQIGHSGRLNVLANEGTLKLDGEIVNIGDDMTYVAARANGDGITATEKSSITSSNGLVLVKNITGQNGMDFKGSIDTVNSQAELYNKAGDMNVAGTVDGEPTVILNTGRAMTITDKAQFGDNVIIVNKGTQAAKVADRYQAILKEKLNK